jgi:hypothetical protein
MSSKKIFNKTLLIASALVSVSTLSAQADMNDDFAKALKNGKFSLDARYRYELVDQDGFAQSANASTLRTNISYETADFYDFKGNIQIQDVATFGAEHYNSSTNNKTQYPAVIDPTGTEINHANITYSGVKDTQLIAGRQGIDLDNQRFVGTVGWRQNDQSFDAVTAVNQSIKDTKLTYSFIGNVNRIQGDTHANGDLASRSHIINAKYSGLDAGDLVAYSYLFNVRDNSTLSTKTFGLRFTGDSAINDSLKALYTAEYAKQSDYASNVDDINVAYYLLEAGLSYNNASLKGGIESLGGGKGNSHNVGFATPFATLHGHNGWADKFLTTPANGLRDHYASLEYKLPNSNNFLNGIKTKLAYHRFSAENGTTADSQRDYGREYDASISKAFKKYYSVGLKYANYDAKKFATDTEKFWVTLGAKF